MKIIKRDGTIAEFDKSKIENAIKKAMLHVTGSYDAEMMNKVAGYCKLDAIKTNRAITVQEIETKVFNYLTEFGYSNVAKAYEGFRAVQEFKRNSNTTDISIFELLKNTENDVTMENSNKNASILSTQRDLIAGEISKDIARRKILPSHLVQAHDECSIHYHDMDYLIQGMTNCCLINLEDMLDNGTVINEKMVETPKSFETACTVTTQIMAQVSSNQYGGQSITIAHLAPYLRKTYDKEYNYLMDTYGNEEMATKEANHRMLKALRDGVQTIRYQLSTLQSTNG